MSSLLPVSGDESTEPIEPPTATSMPAFVAGCGGIQDRLGEPVGDEARVDLEQHRHEGDPLVLGQQAHRLAVLREGVHDAVDLRRALDRLVRRRDRGVVRGIGELALLDREHERVRAVLLRREPLGQDVERRLAVGARQGEAVVGLGAVGLHQTEGQRRQADPHHDHDDAVPGREPPEPEQEPPHARSFRPCCSERRARPRGAPRGAPRDQRSATIAQPVGAVVELRQGPLDIGQLRGEGVGLAHPFDAADRLVRPFAHALAEPDRGRGVSRHRRDVGQLGQQVVTAGVELGTDRGGVHRGSECHDRRMRSGSPPTASARSPSDARSTSGEATPRRCSISL